MIEKCNDEELIFKTRDLSISNPPYQFIFVLERVLVPAAQSVSGTDEIEERDFLFGFTKAEHQFTCGELFKLIYSIYGTLTENYRDWVFNEDEETADAE